ncbi:MAG TPA: VOC family protein [Ramlibacter sp.]|jgi:catechol 2,3-dioxygenase-like lactoylglutathione lyase family enzyme|nr:VOC family protein [Ramlibacter sp.]
MIHALNHFTVIAENIDETMAFYTQVLGLQGGPRPDLGFPGEWLYADGRAIVHIYSDRAPPAQRIGVIDHIAFSARGLKETKARFDAHNIPYELRRQRNAGTWQLFCHDPNGAKVELDFDPGESE